MSASRKIAFAAVPAIALLTLTACGGGDGKEAAASSAPATKKPAATATTKAPAKSKTFVSGLITEQCFVRDGMEAITLTNYNAKTGVIADTRTFTVGDGLNQLSIGKCGKHPLAAFNADFTRFYLSSKDSSAGVTQIGFLDTTGAGGFNTLSKAAGDFNGVNDLNPSWYNGRVYYMDKSGDDPVLKSIDGAAATHTGERTESALQNKYPDVQADDGTLGVSTSTPGPAFVYPGFPQPVLANDNDALQMFNVGGRVLRVTVDASDSIEVNGHTYNVTGDAPYENAARGLQIDGAVNEATLLADDGSQIYRLDLNGGTAKATAIVKNTNHAKGVGQVRLGSDGKSVAFAFSPATTTTENVVGDIKVFITSLTGGVPEPLTSLHLDAGSFKILAYNQ